MSVFFFLSTIYISCMKGLKKFFLSFLFTQDPDLHYNKFEDPDKKKIWIRKTANI